MFYDYYEETAENIRQWLEDNRNYIPEDKKESQDALYEYLQDTLWIEDSITGNGRGSYTLNIEKARSYIQGNEDLVEEMVNEFCVDMSKHRKNYEYLDVSIRCYVLNSCLTRVLEACTRTCDNCGKVFIEGYICEDANQYYCSEKCLEESLVEGETMKGLKLGENDSPNYRTSRIESL